MPSISRIYVRLPNWVGDVCMSLPSLALLDATGLPLTICARPWARDLLAGVAPAHDFIPMRGAFWQDRAAVRAHVRDKRRADGRGARALSLPDSLSSAAVFRLAGLPVAGYRDDGRSLLLRWPMDKPQPAPHAVGSWYHLTRAALAAWGLPCGDEQPGPRLGLRLTQAHRDTAEAGLVAAGLAGPAGLDGTGVARSDVDRSDVGRGDPDRVDLDRTYADRPGTAQAEAAPPDAARPFVLIAPTATGLHRGRNKVWPGFDELTRRLKARGIAVAMCPPPAETEEARRNAPTALILPPMSLGAFAALAARAALVVCNDSGVSHVAAAVDALQVTLFGVTQRERTGPWSRQAHCLGSDQAWPDVGQVDALVDSLLHGGSRNPDRAELTRTSSA
jgi:heptosyltransferase-2